MTEHHLSPCDGELGWGEGVCVVVVGGSGARAGGKAGRQTRGQMLGKKKTEPGCNRAGLRKPSNGRSGSEIKVCFRCTDGTGDKALKCQMSHQVNQ